MASRDRIYVSKSDAVQNAYRRLTEEKGDAKKPPAKPFRFDRDVFLAAAAVGFLRNEYRELETSERRDKFLWSTLLSDAHALPALRTIALLHDDSPEVLLDDDRVATIGEGYANGGIHVLVKMLESATDEIDEAVVFLSEELGKIDD